MGGLHQSQCGLL